MKLSLKDVKIIGEGPQIRKAICEKYNSSKEFYEIHKVTKAYATLTNYLSKDVITSDSFKYNITVALDMDFASLFLTKEKQIKKHVQNIYDNIREYDQEGDQETFNYLLDICKEEDMAVEIARMYRAIARNYYYINRVYRCIEFFEYAIDTLPRDEINQKILFHCELADSLQRENFIEKSNKKYRQIDTMVRLHKASLDNNTLFYYHYWRGIIYMNANKNKEARDLFRLAVDYASKNCEKASAIANIGLTHKKNKQYKEALKYYEDALKYHDESRVLTTASIYNNIAEAYKSQKDYSNALTYIGKALEISEKEKNLGKHLIYIATKVDTQKRMGKIDAYKNYFSILLSTKNRQIQGKPYVLADIEAFIENTNDIPCLDELADIIIELRNATTSEGYKKGLLECTGLIFIKIKELTRRVYNEKNK